MEDGYIVDNIWVSGMSDHVDFGAFHCDGICRKKTEFRGKHEFIFAHAFVVLVGNGDNL